MDEGVAREGGPFFVNMMGSGILSAAGTVERLEFNVAGTGTLEARALKVQRAAINIAGSGGGEFASDGTVEARIAGTGNVTVYGRADCSVKAMGSGRVQCRNADSARNGASASPSAPKSPAAPETPTAPEAPDTSE